MKLLAFGGSNSTTSINKQLATFAAHMVKNADITLLDLNDYPLPLYSPDIEKADGIHENATALWDLISETDGIVLSLAEYNGSYTTAFKNMFDWLSRINMNVWQDKPMLLLATSPGKRGGANVLQTAVEAFPHFGGTVIANFSLPLFPENFTAGQLTNEEKRAELLAKVDEFTAALHK
ncbi:MAG: NAD(P)H-dependent oxidoreductase [Patescibacteria group bacterium]